MKAYDALVASLDEQTDIRVHEPNFHRHVHAIGQDSTLICPPPLDEAEDVIPSSTVKARRMSPQLVEDLLHLERRGERLDQDSGANGADWDLEVGL